MGDAMDNETKSVVSKLVDKFTDVVDSVTSAASNAAQYAMESHARRMEPDPGAIAGTANEQIFIPEASDAAALPLPLIPMAPERKAAPRKSTARARIARSLSRNSCECTSTLDESEAMF